MTGDLPVDGDGARCRRQRHRGRVLDLHGQQRPAASLQAPYIETPGGTAVGKIVTSVPPAWGEPDVVNSLPVAAQRRADQRRDLDELHLDRRRLRTRRSRSGRPGRSPATSTVSALSRAGRHHLGAPRPTTHAATITGTPAVGNRLTGNRGTWPTSYGSLTYTYAWLGMVPPSRAPPRRRTPRLRRTWHRPHLPGHRVRERLHRRRCQSEPVRVDADAGRCPRSQRRPAPASERASSPARRCGTSPTS